MELQGAETENIGPSIYNMSHVKKACEIVLRAMTDPDLPLTGIHGKPFTILIEVFYRAQAFMFYLELDAMRLRGKLTADQLRRISVRTVDGPCLTGTSLTSRSALPPSSRRFGPSMPPATLTITLT
jgi:hypothetical protein